MLVFGRNSFPSVNCCNVSIFLLFFLPQLEYCCMMFDNGRTLPHGGMVTMFVVMVDLCLNKRIAASFVVGNHQGIVAFYQFAILYTYYPLTC